MPVEEPSWWYEQRVTWQSLLLSPFAAVFGAVSSARMRRPPRYRTGLPVICVGNFTAGGTGKTPLSLALARLVRERGAAPVFLTRGYGGHQSGPLLVDPHSHLAGDVGDEPLLLAREAATVVSRDRIAGAKLIEESFPANAVIIMDDGLQNPSLAKDYTIAIVDGGRLIGNGRCLPAGPLRAPLASQVAIADAILVSAASATTEAALSAMPGMAGFKGAWLAGRTAPSGELKWLSGATVLPYAGIANPARFFALVAALGARAAAERVFPDHHDFTDTEAARLLAEAEEKGARLVTTEKDFVRLQGLSGARAELREKSLTIPITMELDGKSEALLKGAIDRLLVAKRTTEGKT